MNRLHLMDAAAGYESFSPGSMRSYADLSLFQAALGLEPAGIEVWINGLPSPFELTSDITAAFCK